VCCGPPGEQLLQLVVVVVAADAAVEDCSQCSEHFDSL